MVVLIMYLYRPCGMLMSLTYGMTSLANIRGNFTLVLMHSGIVNKLLWDAHTVLEQHTCRGTVALFVLLTIILFLFFFLCVCHS